MGIANTDPLSRAVALQLKDACRMLNTQLSIPERDTWGRPLLAGPTAHRSKTWEAEAGTHDPVLCGGDI